VVDVRALKAILWEDLDPEVTAPAEDGTHSFHKLLKQIPEDNEAGKAPTVSSTG